MNRILFALMFIVFGSVNIFAEQMEIVGYLPEIYSIRDPQRDQLDELISVIVRQSAKIAKQAGEKSRVQIAIEIVGHADKSGKVSENEGISESRARLVKEYLANRIPDAKFAVNSYGDEQNARKVVVVWNFSTISIAPYESLGSKLFSVIREPIAIATASGLVLIILGIIFIIGLKTRKLPDGVPSHATLITQPDQTEILSAIRNGIRYGVRVIVKADGSRLLPFPDPKDPTRFMSKPNRDSAKKEVVQCVRDPRNKEIFEQLLKDETITVIGKIEKGKEVMQ